jgi:hypothetical protein
MKHKHPTTKRRKPRLNRQLIRAIEIDMALAEAHIHSARAMMGTLVHQRSAQRTNQS